MQTTCGLAVGFIYLFIKTNLNNFSETHSVFRFKQTRYLKLFTSKKHAFNILLKINFGISADWDQFTFQAYLFSLSLKNVFSIFSVEGLKVSWPILIIIPWWLSYAKDNDNTHLVMQLFYLLVQTSSATEHNLVFRRFSSPRSRKCSHWKSREDFPVKLNSTGVTTSQPLS